METPQNPMLAAGFVLVASVILGSITGLVKLVGGDSLGEALNPLQISHARFMFAFLAIGVTALVLRLKLSQPNLKLHFLRSLTGWSGISLMFAAVTLIPLTDATAISFLNPVFAMALAIPLLGERVGRWRWAAAAIALAGGLVLLRPSPASFQPAAMLALAAAVVMGVEITIIKMLSGRERPLQILLVNNAMGLSIASVAVLFVWQPPTGPQWLVLGAIGIMMAVAQTCFIQAMRRADASFVVPFSYTTLIFAGLFDFVVFGVVPTLISLIGAGIIVTGALLLAWREGRVRKQA